MAPEKLAAVTAASDVVITVVTDDAAMHAIYATAATRCLTGAAGKTFVNAATITPAVHVEVDALDRRGRRHARSKPAWRARFRRPATASST